MQELRWKQASSLPATPPLRASNALVRTSDSPLERRMLSCQLVHRASLHDIHAMRAETMGALGSAGVAAGIDVRRRSIGRLLWGRAPLPLVARSVKSWPTFPEADPRHRPVRVESRSSTCEHVT